MKCLGEVGLILGMKVTLDREKKIIHVDQSKYINEMLLHFGMGDCHPISTPLDSNQKVSGEMCPEDEAEKQEMAKYPYREAIGSLLYLVQVTRPDINFVVNLLSRYSTNPGKGHWQTIKRVFRYLKGTSSLGITYGREIHDVTGFCDADWSTISWSTKKQPTVSSSVNHGSRVHVSSGCNTRSYLAKMFKRSVFPE